MSSSYEKKKLRDPNSMRVVRRSLGSSVLVTVAGKLLPARLDISKSELCAPSIVAAADGASDCGSLGPVP